VTTALLVLVPPSEAKTPGGTLRAGVGTFDVALGDDRRAVIEALIKALNGSNLRRREIMMNARGPLLERAIETTRQLADEPVPRLAAWRRYNGVVWSHLGPETLTSQQRRQVVIPSSLYGVTTAEDRIADFRLKMNVGVAPLGTMATFWKPRVTPVLVEHAKRATIVNLLPLEHEAAIDMGELTRLRRVIRVQFIEGVGGGHDAKAVKGVLARTLLVEGLEALASFEWQGWRSISLEDGFQIVSPASRAAEGWATKRKKP
jgi:uncharacterized protein